MQRLSALGKPYKYVVTCIIMQKTGGAGIRHSLCVCGQARQQCSGRRTSAVSKQRWHADG